jgi:hypothetical protein
VTKFAPYTYVDENLLEMADTRKRRNFVARNCEKLADFLENEITDNMHAQETWYALNGTSQCGTTGCALGWAAMSGLFPGMDYAMPSAREVVPIINGEIKHFDDFGAQFFGDGAYGQVFYDTDMNRQETVQALRDLAANHRKTRWAV